MTASTWNRQDQTLIAMEVKQFFVHRRSLHFIPLTIAGVFLIVWPHFGSPFVSVFLVLLAGLEPQFNNILFRTPLELETFSILPLDWKRIIRAKNIGTITLTLILLPLVAAAVLYFSPIFITSGHLTEAALFVSTLLFPMLHVGNLRSIQHPRRETGWQIDDIAGIVELLISATILSIPYFIFTGMLDAPVLCVVYCISTVIFWWRYSIPKTASLIEAQQIDICMNR